MDLALDAQKALTSPDVAAFSPAWSPDGRRLAYVSAPDIGRVGGGNPALAGVAQRRIWLMDADGSNQRRLTDDAAYRDEEPHWTADGTQVLFARIDGLNRASVWLVAATGGAPIKVTDVSPSKPSADFWFGYYGHIAWDALYDYRLAP